MNIHLKAKHPFWLNSGKKLESLRELHDELKVMTPEVFAHHANNSKNDFASWVEHSVEHPTLALRLKNADKAGHLAHIADALAPTTHEIRVEKSVNMPAKARSITPKIIISGKRTMLTIQEQRRPIVSKHKTELHLHHEPHRVISHATTPLTLVHHYERIVSENKTLLSLAHTAQGAHHGLLIVSYLSLGLVFGAGLVILFLAL